MTEDLNWATLSKQQAVLAAFPEALRSQVKLQRLSKGEILFRRGDRPRFMFTVISGEARLTRTSASGSEIVLQRTRSGLFAEGSLDQPRYHCDAIAALPSDVAAIPRREFKAALAEEGFRTVWVAELLRELRRLRAQTERLSLHTARDRILHFIESEGENRRIVLSQSKKNWAAQLGLTHEALYRALAHMSRSGEIAVEAQEIQLTAPSTD